MRRIIFLGFALVLSACAGGGGSPAVSPPGAARITEGTSVAERGNTLWVGTSGAVYAYPKLRNGPAGAPKRRIEFALKPGQGGYDTTVAPDGTVYESLGDGVTIYGPWVHRTGDPEEHLSLGDKAVLLGDGIDTIQTGVSSQTQPQQQCVTATISTYAYGAGPNPAPRQTLNVPFACEPLGTLGDRRADFATDTDDRLYVYHGFTVKVFAPGASGNAAPLQTFFTNDAPMPTAFTVGADGTVYILANDRLAEFARVYEWTPADRASSSPSRILGAFKLRDAQDALVLSLSAIAVDGKGRVFLAENRTDGTSQIVTFAPGASGTATPIATLTNPVPQGNQITSLAIGP